MILAAHCCYEKDEVVAFLAENFIKYPKEDKDPRFNTTIPKEGIFIHQEYRSPSTYGGSMANRDVCLLRTNIDLINPPNWTPKLREYCKAMPCTRIACIDKTEDGTAAEAGSACWIAGWGRTDPVDDRLAQHLSSILMQSSVNLLSNKYCHSHTRGYSRGSLESYSGKLYDKLHEDEICTGNPADTDTNLLIPASSFCDGDSGGPLMCPVKIKSGGYYERRPVLTGVVSWNYKCGNALGSPGVFARVSFFYEWMAEIVRNNKINNRPAEFQNISQRTIPDFENGICSYSENFSLERIREGKPTQTHQWPWFASLKTKKVGEDEYTGTCGATIVSNHFLLTGKNMAII